MSPKFVLRPVEERDVTSLKALASSIKDGMTSLPADESALEDRIFHSLRSFDYRVKSAGSDHYLFVLESLETGEIAGTSGIIARVGGFDPFYTYEVRREHLHHQPLNIDREVEVLHLKLDHKGPSEVCSLCLKSEFRRGGLGALLSLSRFLFIATYPNRFDDRIIAELRGFTNSQGLSPFWEAVGHHFFNQTFAEADFLSGIGQKDFIRDLMPKYPIYVATLPYEAQSVIGKTHRDAEPAFHILRAQGFEPSHEVDIFDAGPLLIAEKSNIRAIKEARTGTVSEIHELKSTNRYLIANASLNFRACIAPIDILDNQQVSIDPSTAAMLKVAQGNLIIYLAI